MVTVRSLHGDIENPPDLVCFPRDEGDVVAMLDYCTSNHIALIPYGGGSSVVGGVEPDAVGDYRGVISLDMARMSKVLEVDPVSRAALIQAGCLGPDLEGQLKVHGLTLRHFPQSFARSTLGGWIATRAGGHFATGPTQIDDLVECVRMLTPSGVFETRRLPASGAGPSPDRLVIGSEGILGVIASAWMRVNQRPRFKASRTYLFKNFMEGSQALRVLVQSGLQPSNCRVVDPTEALINEAGDGSHTMMMVAFESAHYPVNAWAQLADECIMDYGGMPDKDGEWIFADTSSTSERRSGDSPANDSYSNRSMQGKDGTGKHYAGYRQYDRENAAATWRSSFIRAPYVRDALVRKGTMLETFETATTWDRFPELYAAIRESVGNALRTLGTQPFAVTCRITHAYADGPAPYFTIIAKARPGNELVDWDRVKEAASKAISDNGGTITHHHAIGREHKAYYEKERPDLFARSLAEAKAVMDPAGILNPGVLI
ncbi:MAG: FAD-binding oxidoreductase [Actinobacteria bacterium]|nr:FAD-binding oxidoreductase [Actinomycetota bacterium]MCL5447008.1 FAD-binding oxidoreductase [Actinomycetota bacterium]